MSIDDLKTVLSTVEINGENTVWALAAWTHAPAGDYGVVEPGSGADFVSDGRHVERGRMCYVHYYTRNATAAPMNAIENALNGIRMPWQLSSTQYEDETQLLHYEWTVTLLG